MIGVFDSGVGGLSVHRALTERLPEADFIYLADQANTPYGGKDAEEIIALTRAGCVRLFDEGASLVVLACNTAAAIALRPLQQYWLSGLRQKTGRTVGVIGLIVPTIEVVTGLGWSDAIPREGPAAGKAADVIGIFATPATVRSCVYETEIHKRRPDFLVLQEACPDLARMIEAGGDRDRLRTTIAAHARALRGRIGAKPWKAILGCTHYEMVADMFAGALPAGTALVHQPSATADALARYLARHPEYEAGSSGLRRFITTGAAPQSLLARQFWGDTLAFETLLAA
jgi:glutamate racemase